jgi:hypothetical protein
MGDKKKRKTKKTETEVGKKAEINVRNTAPMFISA